MYSKLLFWIILVLFKTKLSQFYLLFRQGHQNAFDNCYAHRELAAPSYRQKSNKTVFSYITSPNFKCLKSMLMLQSSYHCSLATPLQQNTSYTTQYTLKSKQCTQHITHQTLHTGSNPAISWCKDKIEPVMQLNVVHCRIG